MATADITHASSSPLAVKQTSTQLNYPFEVLFEIFSYLPKSTLTAVTLTCQVLSDIALDLLWKEVELVDLLRVVAPLDQENTHISFSNATTSRNWDRFKPLAPRVEVAKLDAPLDPHLASDLFHMAPPDCQFLFPGLRSLSINTRYDMSLSLIAMVSSLRSVHLLTDGAAVGSHSDSVMVQNTSMTQLRLKGLPIVKETSDALVKIIALCPALQVVDVQYFETPIYPLIESLARLRGLVDVCLVNFHDEPLRRQWNLNLPNVFPSLKCLDFSWRCSLYYAGLLASLIPHQSLTHLEVGTSENVEYRVADVEDVIALAASCTKLESLTIYASDPRALPSGFIRPLHACKCLQVLEIQASQRMELYDEDIESLVSHMHDLRLLMLWSDHNTSRNPPSTTVRAISIIAAWCPMINHIGLQIDTSRGADCHLVVPLETLRSVNVYNSNLEPEQVQPMNVGKCFKTTQIPQVHETA
ncbi:hypothetical protein FRB98_005178 [Tulasnella sp. 332]|nr:hypothetical protein FRB98_005178 [Tulasnella sp. 332]